MKSLTVTSILAATVSTLVASTAQAAIFTFTLADNNLSTITKTVDGITLTVSNPSPRSTFEADGDGLAVLGIIGSLANPTITSFNLSFSAPVQLIGYRVGYVQFLDGNETITLTAGSSSSVENSPFAVGNRNFSNQFTVAANQTISVINSGFDSGGGLATDLIQWSFIEVAPASPPPTTPEPGSLMALGAIGLGFLGVKKKNNR